MEQLELFIAKFKQEMPEYVNEQLNFYAFGRGEKMANELATLVLSGEKCGTTSLHQLYELENEKIPQVGEVSVILDGSGHPTSVIKNIKIEVLKFKEITKQHAFIEGEGDKSLDYWRRAHKDFFTKRDQEIKEINFDEDSLVVFETFEVIYKRRS